jgi:hypothetical protein
MGRYPDKETCFCISINSYRFQNAKDKRNPANVMPLQVP